MTLRNESKDAIDGAKRTRKIVGVIGGIASGKSAVRGILKRLGAQVLDADSIAHEVLERREVAAEVAQKLRIENLFEEYDEEVSTGSDMLADKDLLTYIQHHVKVDRKKVAKVVFGDSLESKERLKTLESLVQPLIARSILDVVDAWRSSAAPAILLLDIPLLFERGWERVCDEVWFVDTPLEMRVQFAAERGWTPEQLETRERSQLPVDEKRRRADVVIPNDSNLESLEQKIVALLN